MQKRVKTAIEEAAYYGDLSEVDWEREPIPSRVQNPKDKKREYEGGVDEVTKRREWNETRNISSRCAVTLLSCRW